MDIVGCNSAIDPILNQCSPGAGSPPPELVGRDPVVEQATPIVLQRLDRNFFRVRFDRLTPSERSYLRAMAELGAGPCRTGEVAEVLGVKITSLGPVRAKLIRKGMVYSPAHGEMAFTVPLFDQFMRRAVPELATRRATSG